MYTIGDYVKVTNSNITGKIVNISKQYITILANDKIVKLKKEQIEKIKEPTNISKDIKVNVQLSSPPIDEIMIRHQTVEEALSNLDKFIDNAICNNVKIVK